MNNIADQSTPLPEGYIVIRSVNGRVWGLVDREFELVLSQVNHPEIFVLARLVAVLIGGFICAFLLNKAVGPIKYFEFFVVLVEFFVLVVFWAAEARSRKNVRMLPPSLRWDRRTDMVTFGDGYLTVHRKAIELIEVVWVDTESEAGVSEHVIAVVRESDEIRRCEFMTNSLNGKAIAERLSAAICCEWRLRRMNPPPIRFS